jgi:hypothetical protein
MRVFSGLIKVNSKSKNYWVYALISLLAFSALILVRNPIFISTPRFWAEENYYFETFLHVKNWWEGFDTLIYPFHYIFLLRVGAFLATFPELELAPIATTAFGFLFLILPILILLFTDCKYWDSLQKKIVLSLILIFSCGTGEFWLASTNVQTLIPICSFLILLDDNLLSRIKKLLYSFILACAVVTGPTTLFMSPFFVLRYIQTRNKQFLVYCSLLFFLGLLHMAFYFVSSNAALGIDGRFDLHLDPIKSLIYLASHNFIFPLFGYFASIAFRTGLDIIHIGLDVSPYIGTIGASATSGAPPYSVLISKVFPGVMATGVENIFYFLAKIKYLIFGLCSLFVVWIFYFEFKKSNYEQRVYFLSLFLYLSFLMHTLSLQGLGGFRYSYLTSFILLFYLHQKLFLNKELIKRGLIKFLIIISVTIGAFEYYPRTISFSPDVLFGKDADWPVWSDEVALWRKDNKYKPKVWPYLKESNGIWPERNRIFDVNLNEPEYWKKYVGGNFGDNSPESLTKHTKKKFSEEVSKLASKFWAYLLDKKFNIP